ncbi:alpha/beta fold hydrolase [Streptomyces sp. NPDC051217]|uniref:alpha/beta fold hydrolase n=1 Tax=Streptomyces sp. NPDC051217 TaxID=3365644 RepID=UPI0037ADC033
MRRRHFLGTAGVIGTTLAMGAGGRVATATAPVGADGLVRTDLWARGAGGARLFVREVLTADDAHGSGRGLGRGRRGRPARSLLLVHGARPGGAAAFDLPVPGGSLAADLARSGYAVYVMDIRGFGHSDLPPAMTQDPAANPPQVRSNEAVADIDAAVALIRRRRGPAGPPAALGWATGGHWLGMYAALHPDRIADLMVLNTLYAGTSPWPLHAELADPENPDEPRPQAAWRAVTADSLTARWDSGLAGADPDARRDPAVRDAYREAALSADPTSGSRTPPSFRNPTGPLIDAFYQSRGRQFYDASLVRARTLVLRGDQDFWSRPEDSERLALHLTGAGAVRVRTLRGASHYLHLERERYGRGQLLAEVRDFLGP